MAKKKKKDDTEEEQEVDIVDSINMEFGAGAIINMDTAVAKGYDVFSTGSIGLDKALGVGGLPRGRIVEIFGPESSGKTTLTLHVIASAMQQDQRCAFVDAEHALDVRYAQALGVDLSKLAVAQPDHGEQALEICERLVKSGKFGVVVVDSVAALTPKSELEGEMGSATMGKQARLMSQAMRKLVAAVNVSQTCLIFINQTRMKIGVMFGSPVTTSGGNALKFYASIRMQINRIGNNKIGDVVTSAKTRVKVIKNKCAPPFREAEFDIAHGLGIDMCGEVIEYGVKMKLITKAGAWFSFTDTKERIAQGKENAKAALRDHERLPALLTAIREELYK
jgi:recombination protein RecA